jgi:hypothetical protein
VRPTFTAIAFFHDPELPARQTANGQLRFLQLVPVQIEDLAGDDREGLRSRLLAADPRMVCVMDEK